ncbi:putative enterotoxin [Ophiocordyceps camponoti-rufipedis]|uniref:Putative enterotoxin n=1 Tax=Ophiocordyceps camponoti-rufipedis TaxID=2004952 RepID=A0A2C5Z2V9_9HYPO|nr:putative enterotoxin [Ophiocordyceps camponoti-rufipedis]
MRSASTILLAGHLWLSWLNPVLASSSLTTDALKPLIRRQDNSKGFVYRGDDRSPQEIRLAGGFRPWGEDWDEESSFRLDRHYESGPSGCGNEDFDDPDFVWRTAYVSLAKNSSSVVKYGNWLYEMRATPNILDSGNSDGEVMALGGVHWRQVKRYTRARDSEGRSIDETSWINNPEYNATLYELSKWAALCHVKDQYPKELETVVGKDSSAKKGAFRFMAETESMRNLFGSFPPIFSRYSPRTDIPGPESSSPQDTQLQGDRQRLQRFIDMGEGLNLPSKCYQTLQQGLSENITQSSCTAVITSPGAIACGVATTQTAGQSKRPCCKLAASIEMAMRTSKRPESSSRVKRWASGSNYYNDSPYKSSTDYGSSSRGYGDYRYGTGSYGSGYDTGSSLSTYPYRTRSEYGSWPSTGYGSSLDQSGHGYGHGSQYRPSSDYSSYQSNNYGSRYQPRTGYGSGYGSQWQSGSEYRPGSSSYQQGGGYGSSQWQSGTGYGSSQYQTGTGYGSSQYGSGSSHYQPGTGYDSSHYRPGSSYNQPGTGYGSSQYGSGSSYYQPETGYGSSQYGSGSSYYQPGTGPELDMALLNINLELDMALLNTNLELAMALPNSSTNLPPEKNRARMLAHVTSIAATNMDNPEAGRIFGTVSVRDSCGTQYIFNIDRGSPQPTHHDKDLSLVPMRAIDPTRGFTIDVNLWNSNGGKDSLISQGQFYWNRGHRAAELNMPYSTVIKGPRGQAAINLVVYSQAVVARIQVLLLDADGEDPADVYGNIVVVTGSFRKYIFTRGSDNSHPIKPGGRLPLLIDHFPVQVHTPLHISADLWDWDRSSGDDQIVKGQQDLTPQLSGTKSAKITGPYGGIEVRVTWE